MLPRARARRRHRPLALHRRAARRQDDARRVRRARGGVDRRRSATATRWAPPRRWPACRGARHDAAGHGDHPGRRRAPRGGQPRRPVGGRSSSRSAGPATVGHPHPGRVRQRDHRAVRARRLDERRHAPAGARRRVGVRAAARAVRRALAAHPGAGQRAPAGEHSSSNWSAAGGVPGGAPRARLRCSTSSDHDRRVDDRRGARGARPRRARDRPLSDPVKPAGGLAVLRGQRSRPAARC